MFLHELPASDNAKRKRVGRGPGSGKGKTCGRGHKGAGARSGSKTKRGFEGGQTPLMRRLPKRGFSNYGFRKEVQIVNLGRISTLGLKTVNPKILVERGVIKHLDIAVKILGTGKIDKPVQVTAQMFSKSAIEKIEKSGGKAIFQ